MEVRIVVAVGVPDKTNAGTEVKVLDNGTVTLAKMKMLVAGSHRFPTIAVWVQGTTVSVRFYLERICEVLYKLGVSLPPFPDIVSGQMQINSNVFVQQTGRTV